jgi:hypothetical protein
MRALRCGRLPRVDGDTLKPSARPPAGCHGTTKTLGAPGFQAAESSLCRWIAPTAAPYGFVFELIASRGPKPAFSLRLLAFGERHSRPGTRSV